MAKNFTELTPVVDDLITKRKQLLAKVANETAETVIKRMKDGKPYVAKDIANTLRDLSEEDKVFVLLNVIDNMAANLSQNVTSRSGGRNDKPKNTRVNDIFGDRRNY